MNSIYEFLTTNNIQYERFDHEAAFTCDQADKLCPPMPGTSIKNLFLYDKRTEQHFLIVVSKDKRVDLKELKKTLAVANLRFASEDRLYKYLGVTPGSVTILGLVNDIIQAVTVIFGADLQDQPLQCHPLINTATLVIPFDDIKRFLTITKHEYQFLSIPTR